MLVSDFKLSNTPPEAIDQPVWWFIFRRSRLLVQINGQQAAVPLLIDPIEMGLPVIRRQYLGNFNGQHCYSAEVDEGLEAPAGWSFMGLRQLFASLSEDLFWIAGAASQIVDWDRTHQFCGQCGTSTENQPGERAKRCPKCGLISYPRISPAVIVLIRKGEKLLLARSQRHPRGFYSVLAGFVEAGESLEAAVRREIKEEVELEVRDIHYFGSQPWPFPNSLMIAFTCHHSAGEIQFNPTELEDARWFSVDEITNVSIPPPLSIARQLINWFIDQVESGLATG